MFNQNTTQNPAARIFAGFLLICGSLAICSGRAEADQCTQTVANLALETVQAAVTSSATGDVICLPAGTATWTSTLNVAKAVTLLGAGAGGYVGRSDTSILISTGAKTFSTQPNLPFSVGESITARYTNRDGHFSMTGTVATYVGSSLMLNVTATTGSGTFASWIFERPAVTTLINSAVTASSMAMIKITESTAGNVRVQGIRFETGTGTLGWHITVTGIAHGKPVLIHDNWLSMRGTGGILSDVNRGVVYRNSFNGSLCSAMVLGCTVTIDGAVTVKNVGLTESWTSPSTMGMADFDGMQNFYVEANYFLAFWQALGVTDSGARAVMRHNVFQDSALGSHGADTESLGNRHWEIYDNEFVQSDRSGDPYNLNYWFFVRGGTGVIADNLVADINSPGYWGDKPEFIFTVMVLQRNVGPPNGCWGAGVPGTQYPAPRQVGMGFVSGTGGKDGLGIYRGDSEPVYVWNNVGSDAISISDYGGTECTDPDSSSSYFVAGRDFFRTAKPGWTKYPYPHPLTKPHFLRPPSNLRVVP